MKVKVLFDHPTIEGMIYKDTIVIVNEDDFDEKIHDEKVKGKNVKNVKKSWRSKSIDLYLES